MEDAMDLQHGDAMEVDDVTPESGGMETSFDTLPSLVAEKLSRPRVVSVSTMEVADKSQSISLLEGKLDRYAMDIILSYLTLVEYSRLSIASRIMKDTVSKSTHLYMEEYGLFRKKTPIPPRESQGAIAEPPEASNSNCEVTPQKELQRLMHRFGDVRVLNLQGLAPVGDDLIEILNHCPSASTLKSITLHSCALSYWCPHTFQLQNLKKLTLTGNSIRARMTYLLKDSHNLKSLTFKQCPALRDGDVNGISGILKSSLEELVVNHTKLSKPVASFPLLKHASFAGGFCLTSLARFHCPNLKILNLSFCVRLSERQIEQVVDQSPLLERLILVKCAGVASLDLESKSLRRLDASFTHNMRDLRLACPALEQLDVSEYKKGNRFSMRFVDTYSKCSYTCFCLLLDLIKPNII